VDVELASIVSGLRWKWSSEETRQPLIATAPTPSSSAQEEEEQAVQQHVVVQVVRLASTRCPGGGGAIAADALAAQQDHRMNQMGTRSGLLLLENESNG
jgi:tripartite-type tricarboxylate transporter receptor subunit TctC